MRLTHIILNIKWAVGTIQCFHFHLKHCKLFSITFSKLWQWQIETWMNNLEKKVYHWKLQEVEQNACAAVELWKLLLQIDTYCIAQDLHKKTF